jgi:hypothetical protein
MREVERAGISFFLHKPNRVASTVTMTVTADARLLSKGGD